jgi:predicted transcriptional regulator of viral defense system
MDISINYGTIYLSFSFAKSIIMRYYFNMKSAKNTFIDYIDELQSQGQYWLSRQKTIEQLGLSPTAFKLAAIRLAEKGRLQRLRADFYTIVPIEYRATGSLPAPWFIHDFMSYCKVDYYVGLLSAAALYGAAHQQPMVFQVICNKPILPITVGKVRIHFHYKKDIKPNFYKPVKTPSGYMNVSIPEMNLADLVKYMDAAGQINNIATIFIELIEQINVDILMQFAEQGDIEVSSLQRIGYLIDYLELPVNLDPLEKFISKKHPHYRQLVSGNETPITETNKRWRILVNEFVEADV